jgi:hypothetical protein
VDGSDYTAPRWNTKVLDEGARVTMGSHNGQFPIRGGNRERSHSARNRLHDVMQDNLSHSREAGCIRQRTREMLQDGIKWWGGGPVLPAAQRKAVRQIAKHERTRGPVSVDDENDWWVWVTRKTD